MVYLGTLKGQLLSKPNNRILYSSLDAATFIPGHKGRERQLNKGRMPMSRGQAERGGSGEEIQGEVK